MKKRMNSVYRKAEAIASDIRSRIVGGVYQPGEKLPSRNRMMTQYGVSKVTVQKALEILDGETFVISVDRSGTYVAEHTPHLVRYALLFPQIKEMAEQNHFFRTMAKAANGFNRDFRIDLHYGFEGARGFQRYQHLAEDVKKHRVAGLLFATAPFVLRGTPLIEEPNIPRSAFMTPTPALDIPSVSLDPNGFLEKIVEFVTGQRCQRVATIMSSLQAEKMSPTLRQRLHASGIPVNPDWFQGCDIKSSYCVKALTRLLMSGKARQRPDCLVVTDDNLVPPVTEALRDLNISSSEDPLLFAYCNFPWPTHSHVPATRFGYCMTEAIEAMMKQIRDQQDKRQPEKTIKLHAYCAEEYTRRRET